MTRAALLALLAVAGGCATAGAERARAERLTALLDATAVGRPMDEVWLETRRLLADSGYRLAEPDAEAVGQDAQPLVMFLSPGEPTTASPDGTRSLLTARNQAGMRYRAVARPAGGGVRVELTLLEIDRNDQGRPPRSRRDVDLELALLRRLDAAAAAEVEARLRPADAPPAVPAATPAAP